MKRVFLAALLSAVLGQVCANGQSPADAQRNGNWQGRGDRAGGGRMTPAVTGIVATTGDRQFTVKSENGQSYTVHYTAATRLMDQASMLRRTEGDRSQPPQADDARSNRDSGSSARPSLQASDLHVGDPVSVMGELDAATSTVTATMVMKIDSERAKQMQEQQANFGKTWLSGKLTTVDELNLTLTGSADNAPHAFTVDENTSFRKRGEPATLADFAPGDTLRVEGALKDGQFLAASVTVGNAQKSRGAAQPGNAVKTDKSASSTSDDNAKKSKSKKSSSSGSEEEDGPPSDAPPPDGPPSGEGGPPGGGFGGPPPMGF